MPVGECEWVAAVLRVEEKAKRHGFTGVQQSAIERRVWKGEEAPMDQEEPPQVSGRQTH